MYLQGKSQPSSGAVAAPVGKILILAGKCSVFTK